MPPAIEAVDICRDYIFRPLPAGRFRYIKRAFFGKKERINAVAGFNLRVQPGESVGIVGPNGAGKSTIIEMITGLLMPTSGQVRVMGLNPLSDRSKIARNISVIFGQKSQLWLHLPVIESVKVHGSLYDLSRHELENVIDEFAPQLGVDKLLSKPVRKLSLGERMRCELLIALLHRPRILLLDEPTIGIDSVAKNGLRLLVKRLIIENGMSLVLTSHDLKDIEEICGEVIIVDKGRSIFSGSFDDIDTESSYKRRIKIKVENLFNLQNTIPERLSETQDINFISDSELHIHFDIRETSVGKIMKDVGNIGEINGVVDIMIEREPIESIIHDLYEINRLTDV